MLNSLVGSVQSQGIKVDYRAWLDIGSKEWKEVDPKDKAAAYQAAKVCGWTDNGIKAIILKEFDPRIDDFMATLTIETLRDLATEYPIEIEVVKETKTEDPLFKFSDKNGD